MITSSPQTTSFLDPLQPQVLPLVTLRLHSKVLDLLESSLCSNACSLPSAGDRSNIILEVSRSNHKEQGKFKDNIIK